MSGLDATPTHGGPDALGTPAHDFSTNANACGPCPEALAQVRAADATRYPDPAYTALRARLAALHGVDEWRIVVAGGASEFIRRVTAWVAREDRGVHGEVVLPAASYGDYEHAARAWGLQVVRSPQPAHRPRLAWCCDPSAPQGQAQPGLAASIAALPAEVPCVIDRAYEPLRLEGAALALAPGALDRVWQMWSPNKALGMTGVRAAYAVAPADAQGAVHALVALAASWPVGSHGVAMLSAWAEPGVQAWVRDSLATLREWKSMQLALCAAMGWETTPSVANYHLARPPSADLQGLLAALRAQGIKLRNGASFGLAGQVRMGVLPPPSQDALQAAWQRLHGAN